jgi:phospholipase/lecithinase/hemolysin
MHYPKLLISLIAVAALAGCGGGGSSGGTTSIKVQFGSQVVFGDSLSDVGTYKVGGVAALRGGLFNINGVGDGALTGKNWTELMAAQLGLPAPCPAQTGLQGGDPAVGLSVPVVNHPECNGYAQGGARLFDVNGSGHGAPGGLLTLPVATQIQNYLVNNGNRFKPDALVFLLAGGNEIFAQVNGLTSGATAAGQAAGAAEGARVGAQTFASTLVQSLAATATNPAQAAQAIGLALATENARPGHTDQTVVGAAVTAAAQQPGNAAVASPAVFGPLVAAAQAAATTAGQAAGVTAGNAAAASYVVSHAPLAVAEMGRLGAAFGNLIKTQIVANGANYVTVLNIPDVSLTPFGLSATADQRNLVHTMVVTFNDQLKAAVAGEPKILLADVYTANLDQINNPALHGLTSVTKTACDLSPAKNPLGSALGCNLGNLVVASDDPSHYLFADSVHPTPFGYLLLARFVSKELIVKGWL